MQDTVLTHLNISFCWSLKLFLKETEPLQSFHIYTNAEVVDLVATLQFLI